MYPGRMNWDMARRLIGSDAVVAVFAARKRQNAITDAFGAADAGVSRFTALREKYLLYR
jgi:hypothetical protein